MGMLITGINELVTCDDTLEGADHTDGLGILSDAAVIVGRDPETNASSVLWLGRAAQAPAADWAIDLGGKSVLPGFVDSHSHLVFAGDRSADFVARLMGKTEVDGGIATTVAATQAASDDELRTLLRARADEMRSQGTTTIEIKSGYGVSVEHETRLLRLAAEVTSEVTYLAGHVVPSSSAGGGDARGERSAYVDLVCGEMLAAALPYAKWIDVSCEPANPHAFDVEESRRIMAAGVEAGLGVRVHANHLTAGPGVALAVEFGAASVDDCAYLSAADVEALVGARETTVATLLPSVAFSARTPFADARALVDAGASVALATGYNPGTGCSTSMPFAIALAVHEMGMTPAEALRAATLTAAKAVRRDDVGLIRVGGRADLAVLDAPTYLHLPYRPGVPIAKTLEV